MVFWSKVEEVELIYIVCRANQPMIAPNDRACCTVLDLPV